MVFPIKDITAGANCTVLIDGAGRVWSCGELGNKYNETNSTKENISILNRCKFLDDLIFKEGIEFNKCYCKWNTIFLIDSRSRLWCFGENNYGQCGISNLNEKNVLVENASILSFGQIKVNYVRSSTHHVVVVDMMGHAYGWGGFNRHNELPLFKDRKLNIDVTVRRYNEQECYVSNSLTSRDSTQILPTKLCMPLVKSLACGLNCTSIITESGTVIVYGKCKNVSNSELQNKNTFECIFMLWNTLITLDNEGLLMGSGRYDYGQLSFKNKRLCPNNYNEACVHSNVLCMANGSEHCLAVLSCKCIVSWGWNEHGNCGLPPSKIVEYANCIPISLKGSPFIGCGAGHSLIVDNVIS